MSGKPFRSWSLSDQRLLIAKAVYPWRHQDLTPGPTGYTFCYGRRVGHAGGDRAAPARQVDSQRVLSLVAFFPITTLLANRSALRGVWEDRAVDLVLRAVETLQNAGKDVWVVSDGAYTKRPFVRSALELGMTLVSRLRKDMALFDVPPHETTKRRGRPRKYVNWHEFKSSKWREREGGHQSAVQRLGSNSVLQSIQRRWEIDHHPKD